MTYKLVNGGHPHYQRHKKKIQPALTATKLEHLIFLKKCDIQNYEVFAVKSERAMANMQADLAALEQQLKDLS